MMNPGGVDTSSGDIDGIARPQNRRDHRRELRHRASDLSSFTTGSTIAADGGFNQV
jgi:hypothetical protein